MTDAILPFLLFNIFIFCMLSIDLFLFQRKGHAVSLKESIILSVFWISLALLFNVYIYYSRGSNDAVNFLTGYIIEKSLSFDNLFVFLMIFNYFHTPASSLRKVLFLGVLGAIILRALFIWLGISLITSFHWIIYLFGIFLIYSGVKLGMEKDQKFNPEKNYILRLFRYFFPVTKHYEEDKFFVVQDSRRMATPLFVVLLLIETTDVIFAVDSIPAVLAITYEPFIVYTSNIFAILGLRSLYFVLAHMSKIFVYLHYAISTILVFVGTKMLIGDFYSINNYFALAVIFLTVLISIVVSVLFPKNRAN